MVWAKSQTVGGAFCINPSKTTQSLPIYPNTHWYNGRLDVNTNDGVRSLDLIDSATRALFRNTTASGEWLGWIQLTTAEQPQDYWLPLANGLKHGYNCIYYKNQFGEVTVILDIDAAAGLAANQVVATLPAGFRPATSITVINAIAWKVNTYISTAILLGSDGNIIIDPSGAGTTILRANFSFLAN